MKTRRFVLALIIACFTGSTSLAEQTLTPISSLSKRTRELLRPALAASFHFRMDTGVDCTGTYISPQGHFITALHCVSGCLLKSGVITKERVVDEPTMITEAGAKSLSREANVGDEKPHRELFTYKMTVDDDKISDDVMCPGWLAGKKTQMRFITAGGKGWLAPKNTLAGFSQKFPDEFRTLLDEGYEHTGDFAIIKAEDTKPGACLPIAPRAPEAGKKMHAVSFPCLKRSEISATGETPLYTSGVRTKGFRESEYFRRHRGKSLPFRPDLIERKETFFSTLDIEKCGSGTALLDQQMRIVGIATRVYKSSTEYERGSLESIDVAHILQDLKGRGEETDTALASCQQTPHLRVPASRKLNSKKPTSGPVKKLTKS